MSLTIDTRVRPTRDHQDTIANLDDIFEVVKDHYGCNAPLSNRSTKCPPHFGGDLNVKRGERFIGDECTWLTSESTNDRGLLYHPAAALGWAQAEIELQPHAGVSRLDETGVLSSSREYVGHRYYEVVTQVEPIEERCTVVLGNHGEWWSFTNFLSDTDLASPIFVESGNCS